jgi:NTP pyrophosphatase (non-canonical NTP hydrolase)
MRSAISKGVEMDSDSNTSMQSLKDAMQSFVDERAWGPFHNPKNLASSICIEAAELLEPFQWLSPDEASNMARSDEGFRSVVCDEMADVLLYLFSLANVMNVDLSQSVLKKIDKNKLKYPAERFLGSYRARY